jgi:Flp pilus assembly protein TadG
MKPMSRIWRRARLSAFSLLEDRRAVAAIEFAMIVPIMLLLFFGTVEFSSAVAVDRKVTLIARTLSDVTSQSISVADADLSNFFNSGCAVMYPYAGPPPCTTANNPMTAVISELYVDPIALTAKVQWSSGFQGGVAQTVGSPPVGVVVPSALLVGDTYLILSQVGYLYKPAVAFGMMPNAGITLSDLAYTRPRQSKCVYYSSTAPTTVPSCTPVP